MIEVWLVIVILLPMDLFTGAAIVSLNDIDCYKASRGLWKIK